MLLEEEDKEAVKQWLLPELEAISDASPDILAEYVVALVSADGPVDAVKQSAADALSEFLQDRAGAFVEKVVSGIQQKKWLTTTSVNNETQTAYTDPSPGAFAPIPSFTGPDPQSPNSSATHSSEVGLYGGHANPSGTAPRSRPFLRDPPIGPAAQRLNLNTSTGYTHGNRGPHQRKRKLDDEHMNGEKNPYANPDAGNRPTKRPTTRKGGNSNYNHHTRVGDRNTSRHEATIIPTSRFDFAPAQPGLGSFAPPAFDFSNPASFLTAMASLFGLGAPILPPTIAKAGHVPPSKQNRRCETFDQQGFCILGTLCPFNHVSTPVNDEVPEYDPTRPSLALQPQATINSRSNILRDKNPVVHQGRGRTVSSRARNTKLVVEQIPEEHFSEVDVRQFFSQFGNIVNVQLQDHKRTAVIEFENHDMAQRAYDSPKVIFDNRFVRVFWYKKRHNLGRAQEGEILMDEIPFTGHYRTVHVGSKSVNSDIPEIYRHDEDMIDAAEFERQQSEAQKVFEQRREKLEKTNAEAEEIERKLRAREQEINEIRRKLAEKAKAKGEEAIGRREKEYHSLLNDLSLLHAEAEGLFAQRDSSMDPPSRNISSNGATARGDYRGGGYRGRGGRLRCSVKRMDNRPKRLAISGIEPDSDQDLALRTYLRIVDGCEDVESHTERPNTLVASFSERYQAEKFLDEAEYIPGVGRLRLWWVPNGESVMGTTERETSAGKAEADQDGKARNGVDGGEAPIKEEEDADLDVADDADQWE